MTDEKLETEKILEILEKISNKEIDIDFGFFKFKFSSTNNNFEDNEEEINEDLRTKINDYISAINNYCSKLNEYNKEEHTKEEKESISEELKQIEANFYISELQLKQETKYNGFGRKSLINFYYKLVLLDRNENLEIRENIMEKIGMNNLAFYVYIDNIRYDFLFTKDNITMLDYSTKNTLSIDYDDERIISFIFKKMGITEEKEPYKENYIFKKNKNGLSICNVILKNIYNTIINKQYIIDRFQSCLSENNNLKPEEPFIKAICESGNNIDIFKYILLNKYLNNYNLNSLVNILAATCFGGNCEMIHILEQQIEDINNLNNDIKFNILKQACAGNDCKIVEYLIDKYFKNIQDSLFSEDNEKIIELFEVIKDPAIAIFLLEKTQFEGLNNNGFLNRIFFNTVTDGHKEIAELLLLQPGIKINVKDNNGNTLLLWAVINAQTKIVQPLLSQPDIDVNAKDYFGYTPLHYATESKNTKIVQLLLKHPKIDVNAKDNDGNTPLHYAVENGHTEIVGHTEIIQLLLSNENLETIEDEFLMDRIIEMANSNKEIKNALDIYKLNRQKKQTQLIKTLTDNLDGANNTKSSNNFGCLLV